MLNNHNCIGFKSVIFILIFGLFSACEEEMNLAFSEINILEEKDVVVEINVPKVEGSQVIGNKINTAIQDFVINNLNTNSENVDVNSIEESIELFNASFINFKNEFGKNLQAELAPWETSIEGEVTYQSNNLICISMNQYLNTGAVHGTSKVSFLNFDAKTGNQLKYSNFINNEVELKSFLKPYFEEEVSKITDEDFKLPETIGLSDEGVIILYNINEIPSYTDKLTEFTIPFNNIEPFLKKY